MSGTFTRQALMLFGRHPGDRLLNSLHDGEIGERRRKRLLVHLERCPGCRSRAIQIKKDWEYLAGLNSAYQQPVSESDLLSKLRASIQTWNTSHSAALASTKQPVVDEAEAARRIEAVLRIYLGNHAAAAVIKGNDELQMPGQGSLALRLLLGEKSARAIEAKLRRIAGRVVENAGGSSTL